MLHVILGPPCAGKSTYAQEHASEGEVIVDFDLIAQALGSKTAHDAPEQIKIAAFAARAAAINAAIKKDLEAWIVHTSPSQEQLEAYKQAGAELIEIEASKEECLQRAQDDNRPQATLDAIESYFERKTTMRQFKSAKENATMQDGGRVTGYAATFDRERDAYGDVIKKGAFAKTLEKWDELRNQDKYIPLLYGHSTDDPFYNIGRVIEAEEDDKGLLITAEFDADNEKAQYVRKLVQEGRLYQFSFAYEILDAAEVELEDGAPAYELRELDLFEVSLVQIPANQNAVVIDVKENKPELKAGRVLSKTNADDIKQAISLLEGVLERALDEDPEPSGDEPEANAAAEEPKESNARAKELLDLIENIRKEN